MLTDRHGKDSSNGEEVKRGDDHGGLDRVFPLEDGEFGEEEDDARESGRDGGSDKDSGEDGRNTFRVVPTPLDSRRASNGNTRTSERRDNRVGGGDGQTVAGSDHQPRSRNHKGAGEGEHLDTGVAVED